MNLRIGIQIFYLLLIAFMIPEKSSGFDSVRVSGMLVVVCAAVLTEWLIFGRQKNFFRLDMLFILGFIIVHFQWPLMLLCNVKVRNLNVESYINNVNYGTWISSLGIVAWLIGWTSFAFKGKPRARVVSVDYAKLKWSFFVIFAIFVATAGRDYLTGAIYRGDADTAAAHGVGAYVHLLLSYTVFALVAFYVPVAGARIKRGGRWWREIDITILSGLVCYVLMFLAVGDRGCAVQAVSALLIIYAMFVKSIGFKNFLILALMGAFVLTVIGLGRDSGRKSGERDMLGDGLQELQEMDSGASYMLTQELANSVVCVYASLENTPSERDFFYGSLWRNDLLALVPFAQQGYTAVFKVSQKHQNSSEYLTYLINGEGAISGTGSTIIADLYLNWGEVGVIIFMFGLGVLYKRVNQGVVNREGFNWVVAGAVLAGLAFYSGRAPYLVLLRPIVWTLLITKLLVTVRTRKLPVKADRGQS